MHELSGQKARVVSVLGLWLIFKSLPDNMGPSHLIC